MKLYKCIALVFCMLSTHNLVVAATPEYAAEKMKLFLGGFPDLGPGYGVIVVTADKVILNHRMGLRKANTQLLLDENTPLYIASQTKAYMGLLAIKLDAKNILKLDSKITSHWPQVKFPSGVDPSKWSLSDLLNHKVPIQSDYIGFMEAYVTELNYKDYPMLIGQHTTRREEGFRYDNLGYNIYGAILHKVTGKSWRMWLDEEIFKPLALSRTSTRTSDFRSEEHSWRHSWLGNEWYAMPPKSDAVMQSAGGIVTSLNDMGKWLQLHLKEEGNEEFTNAIMRKAHTIGAEIDPKQGNNFELPCTGYAYGWNVCDFSGHILYIHGGGYPGVRTMMAFSPDLGVGIGVFSNSDNMTGWLTSRTTIQYLQYLTDHVNADRMAELRQKVYPKKITESLSLKAKKIEKETTDPRWLSWNWQPNNTILQEYLGEYSNGDYRQNFKIEIEDSTVVGKMGNFKVILKPAAKDLFGAMSGPLEIPEEVRFERDSHGHLLNFVWQDKIYNLIK